MSGRTVAEIDAELALWYAARARASVKLSYTIKDRTLTYNNLAEINDTIDGLVAERTRAGTGGGARMRAGVPGP